MESTLLPRAAAAAVERACGVSPVVVLLGARQTGKTTLVQSHPLLAEHPYLSLDDFDLRAQAQSDPEAVLMRAPRLVLDEDQRAHELLIAVKRAVDTDPAREAGRFVLTGSANVLMLERISETLAGRSVYVTLWPFSRRELQGLGDTGPWSELLEAPAESWRDVLAGRSAEEEDWRAIAPVGGLPVPALELQEPRPAEPLIFPDTCRPTSNATCSPCAPSRISPTSAVSCGLHVCALAF